MILYLCEHTLEIIKESRVLEKNSCHSLLKLHEVIFICNEYLKVYMRTFYPSNFCFSEFKKCLLQKFLRVDENINLPTEFERITLKVITIKKIFKGKNILVLL